MIEGVKTYPLKKIPDERGYVMRMMRIDDPWYERFGEIYFSLAYPSVIKGWHLHKKMTCNYAVVIGMIKLVLYDDRQGSPTRGIIDEYYLVLLPYLTTMNHSMILPEQLSALEASDGS